MAKKCQPGIICVENYTFLFFGLLILTILLFLFINSNKSSNNILNNPQSTSLDMIHRDTWEPWDKVFKSIADDILKLKNIVNL